MRTLRFKLDSITCNAKAMPGDYADTLNMTLWLYRRDHGAGDDDWQELGKMGSPLGTRGPRWDIFFLPGVRYQFVRTGFLPGTDLDWEFEWQVEDDDNSDYKVAFEVWNDRDVDDPYLLTRVLLSIGVAAGGVAASVALGKAFKEGFAAIFAKFGEKIAGKGLDALLQGLVDDWPDCAGLVYAREWEHKADEWATREGSHSRGSQRLGAPPEGCGAPDYDVAYTISREEAPPQFPSVPKARRSTWVPRPVPGGNDWIGEWSDVAGVPWITVAVAHTAVADQYRVQVDEVVAPDREKVVGVIADQVGEEDLMPPAWNGPLLPAEADLGPNVTQPMEGPVPERMGGPQAGTIDPGGAVPKEMKGRTPGNVGGGAAPAPAPPGPPKVEGGFLLKNGLLTRVDSEMATFRALKSATLRLRAEQVTLVLYDLVELVDSRERTTGPFLRYLRAGGGVATAADMMLARHSLLR